MSEFEIIGWAVVFAVGFAVGTALYSLFANRRAKNA